jgi:ATP-dependent protease ClpP protease subunit
MSEMLGDLFKDKDSFLDRPLAKISDYYLSGTLGPAEDYIDWFHHIRNASENDVIVLHINCFGGDLYSAIQFIRVLQETQATIVASVEGACMSAATMIFLQAHQVEISSHSVFMFHNYSGGTVGKGGEMIDQLIHERGWSEELLRTLYADFLTEKEIESMLDGKDIWMSAEDALKRLESKARKINRSVKKKTSK